MRLSSYTTFFWKFIFTGFFVGFLLYYIAGLFWRWLVLSEPVSIGENLLTLLFFIAMVGFVWWMLAPLKSVCLDNGFLYVSNYLRKIKVPLAEIRHVDNPENSSHQRIFVWLRSPSEFGDVVVFMPHLFRAKETVEQLKRRIELTQ